MTSPMETGRAGLEESGRTVPIMVEVRNVEAIQSES